MAANLGLAWPRPRISLTCDAFVSNLFSCLWSVVATVFETSAQAAVAKETCDDGKQIGNCSSRERAGSLDHLTRRRSDVEGMQREIPGCEIRRHARRQDVERLPQDGVRGERTGRHDRACDKACGRDDPAKTTEPAKETAPTKPAATTSAAPSAAVFPTAVSSKYSSEKAGRARMHTCLDQYNANKAKDANGGLKWIAKGGGYYSECNKRLKG